MGADSYYIMTYTGRKFYPLSPTVEQIEITDIAHSLANLCRFAGHSKKFISVAQHSVMVSYLSDQADALWGLAHDFSEAYLVDLPSPIKRHPLMGSYRDAEERLMEVVCEKFGLPKQMPKSVIEADRISLLHEAYNFMPATWGAKEELQRLKSDPIDIPSWEPKVAKAKFIDRFNYLMRERAQRMV